MSQSREPQTQPYDIVLITTDQQRCDYVGFGAEPKVDTPNLDRLAQGCVFDRCTSINPVCAPARSALLTGKYSHQVGMLVMSGDLSLQHPTFAQALQQRGYYTALTGKTHWLQGWSFDKRRTPRGQGHDLVALNDQLKRFGFDHLWNVSGKELAMRDYCAWCDHLAAHGLLEQYRDHVESFSRIDMANGRVPEVTAWPFERRHHVDVLTGEKAVEQVQTAPMDRPMFLHASFCGPHKPLDPPRDTLEAIDLDSINSHPTDDPNMGEQWRRRLQEWRRGYIANIHVIDEQVGRLLDAIENRRGLENTVIMFCSDHGEMLGDGDEEGKSRPRWQSSRVPAVIRHPDHLEARRVSSPVELTDLTATILDVAGVDPQLALARSQPVFNDVVPCRSTMPLVRGETESIREMVFSECGAGWRMVESRDFKYIRYRAETVADEPTELLFDLDADPDESENVIGDPTHRATLAHHRRYLQNLMDHTPPAQTRWAPFAAADISRELP